MIAKDELSYCQDCSARSFVAKNYCLMKFPGEYQQYSYPIDNRRIAICKLLDNRRLDYAWRELHGES